jgi:hypothetical protein
MPAPVGASVNSDTHSVSHRPVSLRGLSPFSTLSEGSHRCGPLSLLSSNRYLEKLRQSIGALRVILSLSERRWLNLESKLNLKSK